MKIKLPKDIVGVKFPRISTIEMNVLILTYSFRLSSSPFYLRGEEKRGRQMTLKLLPNSSMPYLTTQILMDLMMLKDEKYLNALCEQP